MKPKGVQKNEQAESLSLEGKVAAQQSDEVSVEPEKIDFSNVEIEPLFKDFVDFETFSKSDFRAVKVLNCEAVPKSKKLVKFTLDDGTGTERTILSGMYEVFIHKVRKPTSVCLQVLPYRCGVKLGSFCDPEYHIRKLSLRLRNKRNRLISDPHFVDRFAE